MPFLIHNDAFKPDADFSYEIHLFFDKFIDNDSIHNQIIIVPTRKIVRNLKKYLARQYAQKYNKALNNLFIYNLEDFFKLLYEWLEINPGRRIISEGIQLMLIEQAISLSELKYYRFADNYLKLDMANKIASIVNGLRLDGVRSSSCPSDFFVFDKRKSDDIDLINEKYEELLGNSLMDIPGMMFELNQFLANDSLIATLNKILLDKFNIETIYIIGFSNFRNLEYQILSKFKNIEIPLIINLDFSEIAGPLFGNFQKIIQHFVENEFKLFNTERVYLDDEHFKNKLSYHLFDEKKEEKFTSLSDKLTVIECQNIPDEVQYITKLIKYLNLVEKIPLSDIAIVARKPEDYASLFFYSFKSENIPVNITHRKSIKQSVIVRNLLLLFKIIGGNFTYDQLKLLFESKYVSISNIDKANFLDTIRRLKLRNNYLSFDNDSIKNRADSFLKFINNSLESNSDKYARRENEKIKSKLEKFLNDLPIVQSKFKLFSKKVEVINLRAYYLMILKEFELIRNIIQQIENIQANKENYTQTEYNDLLEAVEAENNALDQFSRLIDNLIATLPIIGYDNISISDLIDRLEIATVNEKYQIREKENYGVTITSIDQIRLLPFSVKILCGAVDGSLPLTYSVEKFLGKELIDAKFEHYRSEKLLFYQFLEDISWQYYESKKFITYPKITNNNFNTISPLLDSLLRRSNLKETGKVINSIDDNDILPINRVIISNEDYFKISTNYHIDKSTEQDVYLNDINKLVKNLVLKQNIAQQIHLSNRQKNLLIEKFYSVSDFESYNKCAYFYYLKKILNIELTKEKEIKLEQTEIGTILHKILCEFYTQLQNKIPETNELRFVELNPLDKEKYYALMLEIINKELSNPIYDHPFVKLHTNKLHSNRPTINPLLNWLEQEINYQSKTNLRPVYFEYPITIDFYYGNEPKDKITYQIKIDRIDVAMNIDGSYDFAVVDYKTRSNNVRNKEILAFKSFQMPIYMNSTIEHFKNMKKIYNPIYGLYYNLLDYAKNQQKILDSQDTKKMIDIKEVINSSISQTIVIKNQIIDGIFEITKDENNCKNCNFATICRKATKNQY